MSTSDNLSNSDLDFTDIEKILHVICWAEVIARDRRDEKKIIEINLAQKSLSKLREKLRLKRDPIYH